MIAPMEENELVGQTKFSDGEELDCLWQVALFMAGGLNTEVTHRGLLWLLLQPGLWSMDFGWCLPTLLQLSCSQGDHCRREDMGSYRRICATSPGVPKEAQAGRRASTVTTP